MGRFVLRSETDTDNPILPRFYGDGITAGQVILYDKIGTRTTFLCLIAQGARFQNDTGCASVRRVVYAGFDIPEFDSSGARNWKFHKGYQSKHPVYRRVTMSDSGSIVLDTATTMANDQKVAFHKRGASMTIPPEIEQEKQYYVVNKTTNTYQISESLGGLPITFSEVSIGTEIFAYRADDAGIFDIDQGRPEFFPFLDFTFSGKAYLEIKLPAELSNGSDEPTRTKIICRGKEVYDFTVNGTDGFLDEIGTPIDREDPALISWDMLRHDLKAPRTRFNGASWLAWRQRNEAMIPWAGGNDNPATPLSFPTISGATYSATGVVTSTSPTNTYGKATSGAFTARTALIDGIYQGGLLRLGFSTDSAGTTITHGIYARPDNHRLYFYDGSSTEADNLGDIYPTDRIKIAFEDGIFQVYRNGVPVLTTGITIPAQPTGNMYMTVQIGTLDKTFSDIRVLPSGTPGTPRQVRRFWGDLVSPSILPVASAFEAMIGLCPGVCWQDVDGEITILPDPDREPVFTFYYDPNTSTESNTSYSKLTKRDIDLTPNYWRFSYRNKDDGILVRSYANADRPARRSAIGGRKIESGGIESFGVLTPSQMDRIGESIARLVADLDFGFNIEGFLDSLIVAKGDYVNVVDPIGGFPDASPSLQMIMNESFELTDEVEKRVFDMQAIVPDWYSDTAHGAVVPVSTTTNSDQFLPAPYLTDLDLTEDSRRLPDGTYIPIIEGNAFFDEVMFGQTGRVFIKKCLGDGYLVTSDDADDKLTLDDPTDFPFINNDPITLLAITGLGPVPIDFEDKLYIRDLDLVAGTFKVSLSSGGAAIDITDIETGPIKVFPYAAWLDTGIRITPDQATMEAGFEIDNIPRGYHFVRVLTLSRGGISYGFDLQTTTRIFISGDVMIPEPPTNVSYLWDGVNIQWRWDASISPSVAGYIVQDEFGNLLYQGDARSFVMPARSTSFAVRVFSYSYSSVVSAEYATAIFTPPPLTNWMNVTGATISENGSLIKTAANGWGNCGAILDYGVLTNWIRSRITYIADALELKVFGYTRNPNANHYNEFNYAVMLQDDGMISMIYEELGVVTLTEIGSYQIGDRIGITIEKKPSSGENGLMKISRFARSGAEIREVVLGYYPIDLSPKYPMYAGVAINGIGEMIAPSVELSGDLFPVVGSIPLFQNLSNGSYISATGQYTATGVGGGSSIESIPANQDGMYVFRNSTLGNIYIGLVDIDSDFDFESDPLVIHLNGTVAAVYSNGVLQATLSAPNSTAVIWSLGRENGRMVLRQDGQAVGSYVGMADLPLVLDISTVSGSSGILSDIRLHLAAETTIDPDGDNEPTTAVRTNAQLARNKVYDIPKFAMTDPRVAGQVLTIDANGNVTNADVSGAYQPIDATLTALAAANWAANSIPVGTGADTLSQVSFAANTFPARSSSGNVAAKPITDFGLSILDDADATAVRSTLGLGTMATQNANAVAITGGSAIFNADSLKVVSSGNVGRLVFSMASTAVDRILTFNMNSDRTITLLGSLTINGTATLSGNSSGTNTGDQTLNSLLPNQSGNSGKYLTTDGTNASWGSISGVYQPLDATLTALAGANWAANSLAIGSGSDTVSQVSFAANTFPGRSSTGNLIAKSITDFGFSLIDDADASTARTTLGLGTMATQNANNVAITGGVAVLNFEGLAMGSDGGSLLTFSIDTLTANRQLTLQLNDADRTLTISGNATISGTNTGDQTLNSLLPSQTGNSGKYLTTDGTNSSWGSLSGIYQPLDATLTALAGANWAANSLAIGSGADTMAQVTFAANTFPARSSTGNLIATSITDFALTILDDSNAATVRTTIGLGTSDAVQFGDLIVNNLTVNGTSTTINTATLTVDDPLIRLADNNAADTVDIGIYGLYISSGSKYSGLFRDASDGKWKLFSGLTVEPTTTVNLAGLGYSVATLYSIIETPFEGFAIGSDGDVGRMILSIDGLSADRFLTINLNNSDRTISLSGNLTISGTTTISGTHSGTSSGTNTGDQTLNSLLPSQTGNSGKFLTTDGTNASWGSISGVYQPLDATLTALAGANWAANSIPIGSGSDTLSQISFAANTFPARSSSGNLVAKSITDFGLSLIDDADASTARTTLGLGTIATQNANNVAITGGFAILNYEGLGIRSDGAGEVLTISINELTANRYLTLEFNDANRSITFNGNLTIASGGAIISGTNTGDQTLNSLLPSQTGNSGKYLTTDGTNSSWGSLSGIYQPLDGTLTALALANWAANSIPIGSGSDTLSQVSFAANTFPGRSSSGNLVAKTITDFGFSLIDDTDASTARTTLGLGTIATQNADNVAITGGFAVFNFEGLAMDSDGGSILTISINELTANRQLTIEMNDADRILTIAGNATISGTNSGDQTLNGLLPSQTGHSGKYLTTDGTNTSWGSLSGIYQPLDATLTALAGANWAANSIPIGSGSDTLSQISFAANTFPARSSSGNLVAKTITDFGFSLIDDADASTARTTLGLGTMATQNSTAVSITGGNISAFINLIDSGITPHLLQLNAIEDLGVNRTLSIAVNGASRLLSLQGNATISGTNTGDQTITLTGDVTGSGTGSFAATIANNAVTLAKMATMATASILGRNTAGTGNVEVLSASTARTVLGLGTMATQNADNVSITGGVAILNFEGLAMGSDGGSLLTISVNEVTANRTLTIEMNDADRTLIMAGNATISGINSGDQTLNSLLPSQTGNSGKYLTTDGTNSSWGSLGSVYQPLDATLTALAGANWAANSIPIGSGSDTLSQVSFAANTFPARSSSGNLVAKTITDFGLSLIDDADASAGRTTLGLGTIATQNADNVAITGGSAIFNFEGLGIKSDSSGHPLIIIANELSAPRNLNIEMNDADRILSITGTATISGTNTGNVTLSGESYLSLSGQVITMAPVSLSGSHVTGTLTVNKGGTGITSFGTGVATWLGTPTAANFYTVVNTANSSTVTGTGSLVFSAAPTLTGNVKGGTFNADGGTNPGNTYFYLSTSQSFASNSSGANIYVNNSNAANAGLFGIIAEARQGTDRSGGAGVIYGGQFRANIAGNVETAYGLYGRLAMDAGKTAFEAGAVLFGTTINGTIQTFSGLKEELINAGSVTDFYGTYTRFQNNSGGTITNLSGLRVSILNNGNTIPTFKGISFESYTGSGAITNNYLIYADATTDDKGSTDKFGLYFLPDMPSYHIGKFGIGSGVTSPTARLQVRDTSNPFRAEYDASNYFNIALGSTGSTTIATVGSGNAFIFTPSTRTSVATSYFTFTTPADTSITTATESIGSHWTAATRTWVDGTVTLQRERVFAAPTYNKATTAATFTTAINVDIADPINGTGVTFTNKYSLRAANVLFTANLTVNGFIQGRKKERVYLNATSATLTPEKDTYDIFFLQQQDQNLTIANHSTTTPNDGDEILIRIQNDGAAYTITWGTNYVAKNGVALPSAMVSGKYMSFRLQWYSNLSKYNLMSVGIET